MRCYRSGLLPSQTQSHQELQLTPILAPFFNLYNFTTGRRLFAAAQVRQRAGDRGLSELVARVDIAIEHDEQTRVLDKKWEQHKAQPQPRNEARAIDVKIDRNLAAIQETLLSPIRGLDPNNPARKSAQELLDDIFPDGVGAHIHEAHVDQLSSNDLVVETLEKPVYSATIAERGLQVFVDELEALNDAFRTELNKAPEATVSFDVVLAHRSHGQEYLLETLARILGQFPTSSTDDIAARAELLAPILHQNEAIAGHLRRRRPIPDVDPETGEETGETETDAVAPHGHTVVLSGTNG